MRPPGLDLEFSWPPITAPLAEAVRVQLYESLSLYRREGVIAELEDGFASYSRAEWALSMSSGTTALHSAYFGIGIQPGDEVLCTAYTFFATGMPLLQMGAHVVLVDVDQNGRMDVGKASELLTARTVAVVLTHMWGDLTPTYEAEAFCNRHQLALVEDCSHSFSSSSDGRRPGEGADVAAWSLQAGKPLPAGEGGLLVGSQTEIKDRALLLGHFNKRCLEEIAVESDLRRFAETGVGLKYRLPAISAAIANYFFRGGVQGYLDSRREIGETILSSIEERPTTVGPLVPPSGRPDARSFYTLPILDHSGIRDAQMLAADLEGAGFDWFDIPRSSRSLSLHEICGADGRTLFSGMMTAPLGCPTAESISNRLVNIAVPYGGSDVSRYVERFEEAASRWGSGENLAKARDAKRLSVGGLILAASSEGIQVLLLKRSDDDAFLPSTWDLPGGKVEAGESTRDALVREIGEETTLTTKALARYVSEFSYLSRQGFHTLQRNFIVRWGGSAIHLSSEHQEARWFPLEQFPRIGITTETIHVFDSLKEMGHWLERQNFPAPARVSPAK